MTNLFHLISSQMGNQIVGGGLVLMFTGSIIALARNIPLRLWSWAKRRCTFDVQIDNSDPLFGYVSRWLDAQPYSKRARALMATTEWKQDEMQMENKKRTPPGIIYSPSPGNHVFLYGGNVIFLHRHRETPGGKGGGTAGIFGGGGVMTSNAGSGGKQTEFYTITTIGHNQQVIRKLISEIVDFGMPKDESINIWRSVFDYWKCAGVLRPRKLESVILDRGIAESLVRDTRVFISKEDWYRDVGIPWHRGYLLHGVPGSGKTSLVCAIAGELGMDLYVLNVSSGGMNDEKLATLMADVRPGTIVLMEDVDCTFPDRENKPGDPFGGKVTLSGLLNVLDGVQSQEGCIVFMTTNNRSKLDAAIVRPGRVDVEIQFGLASADQVTRLAARLTPDFKMDRVDLLINTAGMTMAEVQKYLLDKERECPQQGRALRQVV